jgi:sugar/nucleoside kinase (ribokinase family)
MGQYHRPPAHKKTAIMITGKGGPRPVLAGERGALGVVTRGAEGAMTMTREDTVSVPAFPIERLVDTTGAGDLFAGGFLFGLARGFPDKECLRLGALAAAEVIQHLGARPQRSLREMAQQEGLAA